MSPTNACPWCNHTISDHTWEGCHGRALTGDRCRCEYSGEELLEMDWMDRARLSHAREEARTKYSTIDARRRGKNTVKL